MICYRDFVGRREAPQVPEDVVAAINAALQAYVAGERDCASAAPINPWGLAGRREAAGYPPVPTRSDFPGH